MPILLESNVEWPKIRLLSQAISYYLHFFKTKYYLHLVDWTILFNIVLLILCIVSKIHVSNYIYLWKFSEMVQWHRHFEGFSILLHFTKCKNIITRKNKSNNKTRSKNKNPTKYGLANRSKSLATPAQSFVLDRPIYQWFSLDPLRPKNQNPFLQPLRWSLLMIRNI